MAITVMVYKLNNIMHLIGINLHLYILIRAFDVVSQH